MDRIAVARRKNWDKARKKVSRANLYEIVRCELTGLPSFIIRPDLTVRDLTERPAS